MLHVRLSVVGIKIGFYKLIPGESWRNRGKCCVHPLQLPTPLKHVEDPTNEAEHPNFKTHRPTRVRGLEDPSRGGEGRTPCLAGTARASVC